MKTVKGLSRREFDKNFGTNEKCKLYLYDLKWKEGYSCRNCKSIKSVQGKKLLNRRCSSCGYEESPLANTLFHNIKFDLYKAFGMVHEMMTNKKGSSSIRLGELFEVSQNTAWLFRRKIQSYLKSSKENPLTGLVHVDEFEIGTPEKGKQGRSKTDKKIRLVLATEIRKSKSRGGHSTIGNAYVKIISDFSTTSLKPIFEDNISTEANVVTDGWASYQPFKETHKNLKQIKSDNGANFKELHIQIRNFKNWLRGTHSYCDWDKLQDYINEYIYRLNRRNFRKSLVTSVLDRFVLNKAPKHKELIRITT